MSAARRRVGVLGGTFDPPHLGHVGLAVAAAVSLGLDEVWFTPAVPYHKGDAWCSAAVRVAMCSAAAAHCATLLSEAAAGVPGGVCAATETTAVRVCTASVCTVDVDRGGPTFTIDTLTELRAAHPDAELFFVCGSDVVASLLSWGPDAQSCLDVATFAVAHRSGHPGPLLPAPLTGVLADVDASGVPAVSSTALRAALCAGATVEEFVPPGVADIIAAEGLYLGDARCPTRAL